jgi:hypothetical protein
VAATVPTHPVNHTVQRALDSTAHYEERIERAYHKPLRQLFALAERNLRKHDHSVGGKLSAMPPMDELMPPDQAEALLGGPADDLIRKVVTKIVTPIMREYGASGATVSAADITLGPASENWNATNPVIDGVLQTMGQQIRNILESARRDIMDRVQEGYDLGMGTTDIANSLQTSSVAMSASRARMIARTEMAAATNGGSLAAVQASGAVAMKTWSVTPGAQHPRHELSDGLDGQTVPVDQPFDVDGYEAQHPADPNLPPEEAINCLPGDSLVAGAFRVGMRYWYDGPLVRVELDDGEVLSATPHHPVLTSAGWQPIGLVAEGDYLVRDWGFQYVSTVHPDVEHAPAPIEEVFAALARAGQTRRVRAGDVDFHGDRPQADVDVVRADRLLWFGVQPAFREPFNEQNLATPDLAPIFRSGDSLAVQLVGGRRLLAASGMRGSGQSLPLIGARVRHALEHGSAAISRLDSSGAQSAIDSHTADPEAVGDALDGFAITVTQHEVVSVEQDSFSGHVYNLQSRSGVYTTDRGTIQHNCRCYLQFGDQADGSDTAHTAPFAQADRNVGPIPQSP